MGRNRGGRFAHPTAGEMTTRDLHTFIEKLTSSDDDVAEKAAVSIIALGESALPALFGLLNSTDPNKRWWALRCLAEIIHPTVPPNLRNALQDPNPDVRQCAALGLCKQPWAEAIPDLASALSSEDRLLARLTGDAMIAIGSQATPSLIDALENGTPSAQIEAARSLAMIEDGRAIPALFKAWNNGSPMVKHWAEEGFDRMGIGMRFFIPE